MSRQIHLFTPLCRFSGFACALLTVVPTAGAVRVKPGPAYHAGSSSVHWTCGNRSIKSFVWTTPNKASARHLDPVLAKALAADAPNHDVGRFWHNTGSKGRELVVLGFWDLVDDKRFFLAVGQRLGDERILLLHSPVGGTQALLDGERQQFLWKTGNCTVGLRLQNPRNDHRWAGGDFIYEPFLRAPSPNILASAEQSAR